MDSILEQIRAISPREYIESWGHDVGRNNKCVCPVCGSGDGPSKTPAFHVYEKRYYCYSCQFSGDIIELNRKVHDLSFVDAVNRVADECGLDVTERVHKPRLMIQVGEKPDCSPRFKDYRAALADPCHLTRCEEQYLLGAFDEFTESELSDIDAACSHLDDGDEYNAVRGIALRKLCYGEVYDKRILYANELLKATTSIYAKAPGYDWLCLAIRYFRRD